MYISRVDKTVTFETHEELIAAQEAAVASGDIFVENKVFDMTWVDDTSTTFVTGE